MKIKIDFQKDICDKIPLNTAILKLIEELAEAQTELVKYLTKDEEDKPSLDIIAEELGDVLFRGEIVIRKLGIESKVEDRGKYKTRQINNYLEDNKSFEVIIERHNL
jgi:hypothetical protein